MKFSYPEGATPVDDLSGLIPNWVKTQIDLNQVEAEKYLMKSVSQPQNWFTVSFLQKIHYDMFFDVWSWAGVFRQAQTVPGIDPYQNRSTNKSV